MPHQIPWTRVVAEGVVIVLSILLAFGIDAWWDERQERRQEAEYLSAIMDEMTRNLEAIPGNRSIWERSYGDLLRAQALLRDGLHDDSASAFVMSLNRGLIYGMPAVSTAVFDDLTNSGGMAVIQDLEARRVVVSLYARVETEMARFARTEEQALANLVNRHTPPGLIHQVGPTFTFDEEAVSLDVLRSVARALGSEEFLSGALNAELRRRERERAFLDNHEQGLDRAREEFARVQP
jgi:hypothetical protein